MAEDTEDTIFEESDVEDRQVLADIDFSLMETGRWMLKVIGGPNNGAEFFMEPGHSYIIGTSPASSDIVFHDVSVSRKHARLSIDSSNTVTIEDLNSRNGVLVDEEKIEGKTTLTSNSVVSIGTTTFIVFDRENDRNTVMTPLLPSIVKTLKGESKTSVQPMAPQAPQQTRKKPMMVRPKKEKSGFVGTFFFLIIIGMILAGVGIGTSSLFKTGEINKPQVAQDDTELREIMAQYPQIKFEYNSNTGELLMIGHVLTASDRTKLLYNLSQLNYIKNFDPKNIIIDEGYWKQINSILSKNPKWRGVSMIATEPGKFVLTGYLKTREEAERLGDYIVQNFPFIDRLERNLIVEEDVITEIGIRLQEMGFRDVIPEMVGGDLTLSGTVSRDRSKDLNAFIDQLRNIPAIRSVKNFVVELEPVDSIIDLTPNYTVSGSSNRGGVNINVVINGKILMKGDLLDGMTITQIDRSTIYLERDGVKYKIEYNR